jgi:hypothetical protein
LCLARSDYSAETAAIALGRLLTEVSFAARAKEIGVRVQGEEALALASDAVETML